MDQENTPIYGWTQPALGRLDELLFQGVAKPKTPKLVSWAARQGREALGRNLVRQLAKAFPQKSLTFQFEKVESDTGISLSTLQRIADGKVGPSVDTLANIAHNLGCSLADLFAEESKDRLLSSTAPESPSQRLRRISRKK